MFNIYTTSILFTPPDKVPEITSLENQLPLCDEEAIELAVQCTKRCSVGYVKIVWVNDDSITFEWHHKLGVMFPKL